jgi:hypothetical protein
LASARIKQRPSGRYHLGVHASPSRFGRWYPVVVFGAIAVVLFALVWVSASNDASLPQWFDATQRSPWFTGPSALEGWVRYDAGWYTSIANNGYFFSKTAQSSVAFFPMYPLSMRGLGHLLPGDATTWGVGITLAAGLSVAVLFHRWTTRQLGRRSADVALLVLLLWPYSWYLFGAVYADALFIAAVLASFCLLEDDHPVLAGLAAAVATATRPVGAAVMVGLVARSLERRDVVLLPGLARLRWVERFAPESARAQAAEIDAQSEVTGRRRWIQIDLRSLRVGDAGVLLGLGGLVGYMVFLAQRFGEPLAFEQAQSAPGWDQQPGPKTWLKTALASRWVHGDHSNYTFGVTFQGFLSIGALLLVVLVLRKLGWGYAMYLLAVLAIPLLGSKDFQGLGRYTLAAFPAFAVAGDWLAGKPRLRLPVLGVSAAILVFLCSAFARGAYVA